VHQWCANRGPNSGRNAVYGIFQFLPKMPFFALSDLEIRKERKNKARKKI